MKEIQFKQDSATTRMGYLPIGGGGLNAGYDTVDANVELGFPPDPRQYGIGAQILEDLGIRKMRLITNNPTKRVGLEGFNLEITETIPIIAKYRKENIDYMDTKRTRMGHLLDSEDLVVDEDRNE